MARALLLAALAVLAAAGAAAAAEPGQAQNAQNGYSHVKKWATKGFMFRQGNEAFDITIKGVAPLPSGATGDAITGSALQAVITSRKDPSKTLEFEWPIAEVTKSPDSGRRRGLLAQCDILSLVLGPLSLDLLGLMVNLNKVILDITAQTGAGNLLGNLLCPLLGLLDTPLNIFTTLSSLFQALGLLSG